VQKAIAPANGDSKQSQGRNSYEQDDAAGQPANFSRDLDDDIPFAPEFR